MITSYQPLLEDERLESHHLSALQSCLIASPLWALSLLRSVKAACPQGSATRVLLSCQQFLLRFTGAHARTHMHTHMHTRTHAHTHTHMHTHMHTRTRTHMHTHYPTFQRAPSYQFPFTSLSLSSPVFLPNAQKLPGSVIEGSHTIRAKCFWLDIRKLASESNQLIP